VRPSAKLVLLDNVEPGLPLERLFDTLEPLGVVSLVTTPVEPTSQHIRLLNLEVLDPDAGVRLFTERYAGRGGRWDAPRDMAATRAIAEALGGLPLPIELAAAHAARIRLPLSSLADELSAPDALARLNDPRDPTAGVRYSLRKTLLALTPAQRVHFAALGLPEGPDWPLPIVERMVEGVPTDQTSVAPTRDDLEALVAYSLVSLMSPSGQDATRVRLHPLVRELAREEWARQPETTRRAALAGLAPGAVGHGRAARPQPHLLPPAPARPAHHQRDGSLHQDELVPDNGEPLSGGDPLGLVDGPRRRARPARRRLEPPPIAAIGPSCPAAEPKVIDPIRSLGQRWEVCARAERCDLMSALDRS
jgi:hypothetical protein